jgi:hypothetical protein
MTEVYSQTLAIDDVTVIDKNKNGHEMENIAVSRD